MEWPICKQNTVVILPMPLKRNGNISLNKHLETLRIEFKFGVFGFMDVVYKHERSLEKYYKIVWQYFKDFSAFKIVLTVAITLHALYCFFLKVECL
jgi:hypothetical protein